MASSINRPAAHKPFWRLGLFPAITLMLLASVPQLNLWLIKGQQWGGSYVSFDFDEPAYSAYLQAVIDGKPRRSDPYAGATDSVPLGQPETIFSIQFLPAYVIAVVARIFRFSASTMFIVIRPLSAFFSCLALFWLLASLTENDRFAAVASFIVLCLGAYGCLAHRIGLISNPIAVDVDFPFLRSFVPGVPFPLFFVLCGVTYRWVTSDSFRAGAKWVLLTGTCFGALVFSYFFLWTAAAAWLGVLVIVWSITRPGNLRVFAGMVALAGLLALAALIPYAILLNNRSPALDADQLLLHSRAPDLTRISELIAIVLIAAIILAARRCLISWKEPTTLFAISFSILPIALFNQQVLTGYSLQPLHYDRYVIPYSLSVATVLLASCVFRYFDSAYLRRAAGTRLLTFGLSVFLVIPFIEVVLTSRTRARLAVLVDAKWPAIKRAVQLRNVAEEESSGSAVIFFTDLEQADIAPTVASAPVLWSPHAFVFSGRSPDEQRERLYRYLYFTGVDPHQFGLLASTNSYLSLALFGFQRTQERAEGNGSAISVEEVVTEEKNYSSFVSGFDLSWASSPPIDCVVTPSRQGADLSNFDRWYDRYEGNVVDDFTVYRAKLRGR